MVQSTLTPVFELLYCSVVQWSGGKLPHHSQSPLGPEAELGVVSGAGLQSAGPGGEAESQVRLEDKEQGFQFWSVCDY